MKLTRKAFTTLVGSMRRAMPLVRDFTPDTVREMIAAAAQHKQCCYDLAVALSVIQGTPASREDILGFMTRCGYADTKGVIVVRGADDSPAPRTHSEPLSADKYPLGARVVNLRDELDDDEDRERITPAGSVWSVALVDGENRHIVCEATGAAIIPTVSELDTGFVTERTDDTTGKQR
jgi:hypothetical protein